MTYVRRKKLNVLLDLDNTLVCAKDAAERAEMKKRKILSRRTARLRWKDMDGVYAIFERPHLQDFLDWLFAYFNVSVWTAASKSYAVFIVREFVIAGRPDRRLDYLLFSHHCRRSERADGSQKCISMFRRDAFPVDYDPNDTFIVDDLRDVFDAQPDRCLSVRPFDVADPTDVVESDVELKRVAERLNEERTKRGD